MDESKMNFEETVEYVEFMDDFIPEETVHKPLVFFEEKRIVYGNIIEKNLDKKTVRSISRTLGYELYDGQIYDFDTNEVYEQCTLGKNIPEGKSFLVSNRVFKNSNLKEITILDFGCGKSYLTFLIYHYFVNIKKIKAHIIGYDIKKDVVETCNKLAKKYNYTGLEFVLSDIKKDKLFSGKIDMVITLHACDTATDYALNFAIQNKAKYIFSVPCCQHEINLSINKGGELDIMLKDGIIKERFCALLTDEFRAEILRAFGYSVDMIEFVDFAHSPKNIMIRAKQTSSKFNAKIFEKLQNYI